MSSAVSGQAARGVLRCRPVSAPAPTTPFHQLGGADRIRRIVERFYDVMSEHEPALARLHPCDDDGRVARDSRDRFALFLIGWLGGPDDYVEQHGHPRLRMRHGRVAVDEAMRDAWLRSMTAALDAEQVTGDVREFLDARFAEVADFLRNVPG
jgi:hemoglobin